MDFGIYDLFQASPGETTRQAYDRGLIEAKYAETLGLDTVWFGNAPFNGGDEKNGYVFSIPPFVAAAIVAASTSKIKLGTSVSHLPLFHPVDTARFAASIDHASRGRFLLGVGRGVGAAYGDSGFKRGNTTGVDWVYSAGGDIREVYLEALDVLKGLLNEDLFTYDGKYYQFNNIRSTPRAYGERIPLFAAVQSARSFREMGERGVHIMIPMPGYHGGPKSWEETASLLGEYRDRWREGGHPGVPQVVVRFPLFLSETDDEAYVVARRVLETMPERRRLVLGGVGGSTEAKGLSTSDPNSSTRPGYEKLLSNVDTEQTRALGWGSMDEEIEKGTVTGGPGAVADRVALMESRLRATGILVEHQYWTTTRDDQMKTLRLLADEVAPKFR